MGLVRSSETVRLYSPAPQHPQSIIDDMLQCSKPCGLIMDHQIDNLTIVIYLNMRAMESVSSDGNFEHHKSSLCLPFCFDSWNSYSRTLFSLQGDGREDGNRLVENWWHTAKVLRNSALHEMFLFTLFLRTLVPE